MSRGRQRRGSSRSTHSVEARRSWLVTVRVTRRRVAGLTLLLAVVVAVAGIAGIAMSWRAFSSSPHTPRAAIVDQLAVTDPDGGFVTDATERLERAGYKVDYYPARTVTVDFYRDLPRHGYALIVLRSHASDYRERTDENTGAMIRDTQVGIFTNEPYSPALHVAEQYAYELGVGTYPQLADGRQYFNIVPEFVSARMRGRFDGTLIVLMGCAGLKTDGLAKAFIARGASQFVSWDAPVTAAHTDKATASLLQHLIGDRLGASEAVARAMADVGPDPDFGARLRVFP